MSTEKITDPAAAPVDPDVAVARANLEQDLTNLFERLNPRSLITDAADTAKQAAGDAGAFLTGAGLPEGDTSRARNAKAALGAAGTVAGVAVIGAIKRARGHKG